MRYALLVLVIALLLAVAPPLPPFPTEVRPRDASIAPANSALFILGDPAPAADTVGIAPPATVERIGCCVIRARLDDAPAAGDSVSVNLTSPSGDANWTFTVGDVDDTAPTFTQPPSIITQDPMIIGVDVADDTQVGMVTASLDGALVGVTVDGFVLSAELPALAPGEHCLELVVVDVAENESAPAPLCFTVDAPGEGEGEGEGDVPPSCAATSPSWFAGVLLLLLRWVPTRAGRPRHHWVASVALVLLATPTLAAGVTWQAGSLDDVMKRARAEKKLVLVEVWATWCSPCKKQAAEVFETPEGAALTKNMLAWRVDFDAPEQRALMERWNVLSLPTVLVVRPDGTEVDRIEGYDSKDAFLVEARTIARGVDPLPVLEKKAKTPADFVEVGHRKLVRGDPEGARILERIAVEDNGEPAQEALFLLGRYHARVKREFHVAKHIWRELYTRFPAGKYVGTAAWWYAGALHETNDSAAALAVLERRARRSFETRAFETGAFETGAVEALVDFVVEKKVGRDVAMKVLDDAPATEAAAIAAIAALKSKL